MARTAATSDRDGRRGVARPRGWHQRKVSRPCHCHTRSLGWHSLMILGRVHPDTGKLPSVVRV
eukprot:8942845-Pyramimonas_sp.AAC.1